MSSLVSTISGQFSRSLILGAFAPSLAFVMLWYLLVTQWLPFEWTFLKPLETLDAQWQVAALSLAALGLSLVIYNLNIPIVQLYEGYNWKEHFPNSRQQRRHRRQFAIRYGYYRALYTLTDKMSSVYRRDPRIGPLEVEATEMIRSLNLEYPSRLDLVLPTRLGNRIRSFEDYPSRAYSMSAIMLWDRLVAVIDKDFAAALDDTKTTFDFFIHSSALCALLALSILLAALVHTLPLDRPEFLLPWLGQVLFFSAVSWGLYRASLGRAEAWGDMVKAAFDMYRLKLLSQLGYKQTPATLEEERRLWDDISQRMIFGDLPVLPMARYAQPSTSALGTPETVDLEVERGMGLPDASGVLPVTVRVRNTDSKARTARRVLVADTVPDGFDYLHQSAALSTGAGVTVESVDVEGTNPYRFRIGDLQPGAEVCLSYGILPRKH